MKSLETKIASFLEKIGIDKALHFLVGWSIVSTCFSYSFGGGVVGFITTILLAFFKEKAVDQQADTKDALYTVYGGVAAFVVCSLLYIISSRFQ